MGNDLFSLSNRVIIITGGLGQLGLAYTKALLGCGARVAAIDCRKATNESSLSKAEQARLLIIEGDVTNRTSLEQALGQILETWGTPHGLINNAAIDAPPDAPPAENGPFEQYPETSWDRVLDVNVKGPFLCAQVFGAEMARAKQGSIINIGSIYGVVSPDQRLYEYRRTRGEEFYKPIAYAASKSALLNMTRYLATYWGASNVRVNSLTLGGVFNHQEEPFLREYETRVPLGRMATAADYLGPVLFLLSDASCYMTGANLVVDGGWTAW